MERCPNCGAPARAGAKFCTTCGYRLTASEQEPTAEGATPLIVESGDPAQAESSWATADAAAEPTASVLPDDPSAPEEATPSAESPGAGAQIIEEHADQVLSSSWPSPTTASWSADWSRDDHPTAAEPLDDRSGSDDAVEFPPSDAAQAQPPAPTSDDLLLVDYEPSPVAASADPAPSTDPPPPDADEPAPYHPSGSTAHAFTPTPEATAATSAIAWPSPPATAAASPEVARALALVDELRALLPQLGNGSSSELESVAQSLEAAIRPSNESADLSELRASMLAARDRPRDIDTVLDLSRRVDDVLALIDHQDQLEAAINGALTRLRAQER